MADFTPYEIPVREAQYLPVMHPGRPIGRDEILKQIYAHLKNNQSVLIYGEAGMGKTALTAALASAYTGQPGGALWLDVNDSLLAELLVRVGRAYEEEDIANSDDPLGMVGAVASTLTQHKPFIVLDGKLDEQAANQFTTRCAEGLPMLLTNEQSVEGPWVELELGKLEDISAVVLFKQKAGLDDSSADIDVYGIAKLLGYKPYPIVIAARAMVASKKTPGEYFKVLQQVAEVTEGDGQTAAVMASFRSLTGALQGLLFMLGATFGGQASAELLSSLSNAPLDSVKQALNILTQLHLVERFQRYDQPYYQLHSVVYDFVQNRLHESGNLDKLQDKVRDSVIAYAEQYSSEDADSHKKLATEMNTFINAARWAGEQGDREVANKLVVALTQAGDFVNVRGYVHELLLLRGFGSGDTKAFPAYVEPASDDDGIPDDVRFLDYDIEDEEVEESVEEEIPSHLTTSEIERIGSGEPMEGININQLRMALAQARQQKNSLRQVQILKAIGKVQIDQEMENEAISSYTEVLNAYEGMNDKYNMLDTLDMLSALMVKTENSQAAVLHASRGVKLAEEMDDVETQMHLLTALGDARQQLGETADSIQAFSKSLEIARRTGDRQNEAIVLYKLGYAQLDNGNPDTAIDTWEQALTLFKTQGKRDYEGRVLSGMGMAYGELERWSEAIKFHTSALHIMREVKDGKEEALQLSYLGQASVQAKQLPEALLRYRQALHLAYESGEREEIVSAIVDLVRLMLRSSRLLMICELLIDDALQHEPDDKDVTQLKERIANEKMLAEANQTQMAEVKGTAQDYAAMAYRSLED